MLEIKEMTIKQMAELLDKGELTSKFLVDYYLKRIEKYDKGETGLHAILEINPDSYRIAEQLDQERKQLGARSLLHGIPIVIKDNISTKDPMPTSAGSLALEDLYTPFDAFVVNKFRASGAIILAKTNMGELMNFMSYTMPDGYSSRGGKVKNPYHKDLTPSGSSSGSAVAIAANFAMAAIGTETNGSLTMPSRYNQLVTIKPTVGLISRKGIIPISYYQDTAGPMTRTVEDAAILLEIMAGRDQEDALTDRSMGRIPKSYRAAIGKEISGKRIGYNPEALEKLDKDEKKVMQQAMEIFKHAGAHLIPTKLEEMGDYGFKPNLYEFKYGLNEYLKSVRGYTAIETLQDLIHFNEAHTDTCLKYGQDILYQAQSTTGNIHDPYYIMMRQLSLQKVRAEGLDRYFAKDSLDVFMTMTISSLAPVSGYPSMTLPAGWTANGQPMSLVLIGKAFTESLLISIGTYYEKNGPKRKAPYLL